MPKPRAKNAARQRSANCQCSWGAASPRRAVHARGAFPLLLASDRKSARSPPDPSLRRWQGPFLSHAAQGYRKQRESCATPGNRARAQAPSLERVRSSRPALCRVGTPQMQDMGDGNTDGLADPSLALRPTDAPPVVDSGASSPKRTLPASAEKPTRDGQNRHHRQKLSRTRKGPHKRVNRPLMIPTIL